MTFGTTTLYKNILMRTGVILEYFPTRSATAYSAYVHYVYACLSELPSLSQRLEGDCVRLVSRPHPQVTRAQHALQNLGFFKEKARTNKVLFTKDNKFNTK